MSHKNHAMAIGWVAISFGNLEAHVDSVVCFLLGLGETARYTLLSDVGAAKRSDYLKTSLSEGVVGKEVVDELTPIYHEFERLRILRNKIVHAFWLPGENEFELSRMEIKRKGGKIKHEEETIRITEIMDISLECWSLVERIERVFDESGSLPNWKEVHEHPAVTIKMREILTSDLK